MAASANLLVHPADLYVGLRSATFVEAGDPLVIDAIVTDLDGNPVADRPIALRAVRLEWKYENEPLAGKRRTRGMHSRFAGRTRLLHLYQ